MAGACDDPVTRSLLGAPQHFGGPLVGKQTVAVAGNNAIVRHAWESESGTGDGKWNVSKIGVLQVWVKQGADWKLLARQAFRTA